MEQAEQALALSKDTAAAEGWLKLLQSLLDQTPEDGDTVSAVEHLLEQQSTLETSIAAREDCFKKLQKEITWQIHEH